MTRRIALIKSGAFSHTNDLVLATLRQAFPEYVVDPIDLAELVRSKHPMNLLSLLREYGADVLARRRSITSCLLRTTHVFHRVRKRIRRRLASERYAFTFQTQSLYDASVPGIPHFVYTDHTHLQNLRYPNVRADSVLPLWWIELERGIYHHADRVLTMSRTVARSVVCDYGCARQRVTCVYAGMNVAPEAQPRRPGESAAPNILFIGTDWERKGGPDLVQAFAVLRDRCPEATLTIVGCTPPVDVPNCEVIGRVPLERVHAYLARADVFCLPTRREPLGVAILEAMGHGLPVVTTNIGAIPETVTPGITGYLVTPGDTAAIAQALGYLVTHPGRRIAMGERGRRFVMRRYTWPLVGRRIRRAVSEVLGSREMEPKPPSCPSDRSAEDSPPLPLQRPSDPP